MVIIIINIVQAIMIVVPIFILQTINFMHITNFKAINIKKLVIIMEHMCVKLLTIVNIVMLNFIRGLCLNLTSIMFNIEEGIDFNFIINFIIHPIFIFLLPFIIFKYLSFLFHFATFLLTD